ncbi:hypothetical protein RMATCC62417_16559 [Rhizopus microsporus]|nr:hypothetical protein RMATCC62417_16559 [Rhizopus microsporus]
MTHRESLTIGFLMNCKGLVELIVLNIGHDAGVLNDQVFVIMVVMALITTFMTTPVVIYLYPEWYQKQTSATIDGNEKITPLDTMDDEKNSSYISTLTDRYCIVTMLNRIETVPSMMALMQLFNRDKAMSTVEIHALRLLELTQRTSDVMKFKEIGETARQDPVLNVLKTFASLVGLRSLHTHLDFAQDYIKSIYAYAADVDADIVLLPWAQQRLLLHHEEYTAADLEFISQALNTISQQCTAGVFVDKGFGLIQEDDDGLMPQIIVVYEMNDEQEKEDSNNCLEFALKIQSSHKAKLTVIGTFMKDGMYATRESMKSYKGEIDKLFTSEIRSNIESKHVKELTVNNILTAVDRPLSKHDLVLIARHSKQTPSSPLSSSSSQGHGLEVSTFGKLGADLLRQGNASLIITQARE